MDIILDGVEIGHERDFHRQLAALLRVEQFYGNNLDALWDLLSASAERPLHVIWNDHQDSAQAMGPRFMQIIDVFERVRRQDEASAPGERFSYQLR
ncbi:MAG: barstar family protein [Stenotrophomonas sp.]